MTARADDLRQGLRLAAVAVASAVIAAAAVIGAGLRLAPAEAEASRLSTTRKTASPALPHDTQYQGPRPDDPAPIGSVGSP